MSWKRQIQRQYGHPAHGRGKSKSSMDIQLMEETNPKAGKEPYLVPTGL